MLAIAAVLFGPMAVQAATASNPYQAIVTRNVFGLVPIPVGPPPKPAPPSNLPKIVPNGIMTIFGKKQVLFKVAQHGKHGNEESSYIMSVGDRQDDIAVEKIDENSATITFDNHGTIQELALAKGEASAGSLPAPQRNHGLRGRIPLPRAGLPPRARHSMTSASTSGGNSGAFGQNNNLAGGNTTGATVVGRQLPGGNISTQAPMSTEEQVIMIEAQRLKAVEDGNPIAKILPPTEMTSQTLGGDGGNNNSSPPAPPAP